MDGMLSNFDIGKPVLADLLLQIHQGKIQLPDLQRSFCWLDDLIIRLLASISKGWPIGAIMLLENSSPHWVFRPRLVEGVQLKEQQSPVPTYLILDGQQRLTALYMALFSNRPVQLRGKRSHKPSNRWYYIDIEKSLDPQIRREQAIVSLNDDRIKPGFGTEGKKIDCSTPENEYEQGLFPTVSTFQFSKWRQEYCKYWNYAPDKLELIDQFEQEIIKRFEHYQLPVIELMASLPRPAVCQVFENVNTQNSVLTFFDLATACFAADNFSLREDWAEKEQQLKKHRLLHSVRETDFLSCVTLVATYYRRQHALKSSTPSQKLPAVACGRDEVLNLSVEEYKTFAPRVVMGYEEAVRFLHGQRIVAAEDLPYQIQLVALAAVLAVIGYPQEQVRSKLEQWFWCGACTAFYTSWHEARASRDMLEVPDWLIGNSLVVPSTVREALFDSNALQRTQRRHGAVYKSISALLRKNGAIDLATGEALSDVNFFADPIECHHLFPTAYAKRQAIPASQYNCLVNLTPLSQLSNKKIGGKAPSEYLQALVDQGISRSRLDAILRSHLVDPESLWHNDFEMFLITRTENLLKLVSQAMGKTAAGGSFEMELQPLLTAYR
jgi:hypothetical protein